MRSGNRSREESNAAVVAACRRREVQEWNRFPKGDEIRSLGAELRLPALQDRCSRSLTCRIYFGRLLRSGCPWGLLWRCGLYRSWSKRIELSDCASGGAQERTRTSTALRPLRPERSASASSATWALGKNQAN